MDYRRIQETEVDKENGIWARGRGRGRGRGRNANGSTFNGTTIPAATPRNTKQETGSSASAEPTYATVTKTTLTCPPSTQASSIPARDAATSSVSSEESKNSTWKPRREDSERGQIQHHPSSVESEIQGPLPAWYKPPAWDVRPARHDFKKGKKEVGRGQRR